MLATDPITCSSPAPWRNCDYSTWPSPRGSASRIMASASSSVSRSPWLTITCRSCSAGMDPLRASSNTSKHSTRRSSDCLARILRAATARNAARSMVPVPAPTPASSRNPRASASSTFWPRERSAVTSSPVAMRPSSSASNRSKISLHSSTCSCVSFSAMLVSLCCL
uniref:Uncharacterized protein n=1 Tax=Arundo donax TaxID=35708 RepID=A0A0A9GK31_ARUDO